MKFLDYFGNDLELTLNNVAVSSARKDLVTGYSALGTFTPATSYIFEFKNGSNIVYVWIPIVTTGESKNPDLIDLTSSSAPSNSINTITITNTPLTPFNFFDQTDYNQWYTSVVGTKTLLASKFMYKVTTAPADLIIGSLQDDINIDWNAGAATYGNKLCYAST